MNIIRADSSMADAIAPLIAALRVVLNSFRGVDSKPDLESAKEEFLDFLKVRYPIFAALDGERPVGYIVCRIEAPCLWVEQLFVCDEYRRKGIASSLFDRAEKLAESMGEDTVYNYVHPNNDKIIGFLRSKGYTVLNMIEVRKPYKGEKLTTDIRVGEHTFDY